METIQNKNKKCSLKKHEEIDAASYCTKCEQFMCKKCEHFHSEFFESEHDTFLIKQIILKISKKKIKLIQ